MEVKNETKNSSAYKFDIKLKIIDCNDEDVVASIFHFGH
jgi:hypothetical protein